MDLERFIEDCVSANKESDAQSAVAEVLARAVSEPGAVIEALGEPTRADVEVLFRSETLSIFNAVWTPRMNFMPHEHLMWANIGIYTGREDNILWRRESEGIKAFGAEALFQKDVCELRPDAVHSVTNPLRRFTGGIHIYGGDLFSAHRSQWDPETLEEAKSDGASSKKYFEEENERLGLT